MINKLIKKRKELKITRKMLANFIGYSYVWLTKIEWGGEKRYSDDFLKKYEWALNEFEKIKKNK